MMVAGFPLIRTPLHGFSTPAARQAGEVRTHAGLRRHSLESFSLPFPFPVRTAGLQTLLHVFDDYDRIAWAPLWRQVPRRQHIQVL